MNYTEKEYQEAIDYLKEIGVKNIIKADVNALIRINRLKNKDND